MNRYQDIYPSRVGSEEKILPRRDPVVYDNGRPRGKYALDREQLDFYERNGFLVLHDYMPEMVDPLRREIDRLSIDLKGREELYTEPDSGQLRTIFRPYQFSDLVDRFSRDPRLVDIVGQILGSDIYIHQSRVNVKNAYRGKSFQWHSDFETWHVEDGMPRMRAVTAWIMLTENNEYNGPLYVVAGSHKHYVSCAGWTPENNYRQSLKIQKAGTPSSRAMDQLLEDGEIVGVYGRPGTVVLHECNIMHGSPDNISNQARSILMFVYNSVENRVVTPFSGQKPRPEYLSDRDGRAVLPLAA